MSAELDRLRGQVTAQRALYMDAEERARAWHRKLDRERAENERLRGALQLAADRLSTSPRHCLDGNCDKFEAGKPCDRCVAAAARRALNNGGDKTCQK